MTDDVFGLGKATAEALALLRDPVKALCGPAFEQFAGAWGDKTKHWREMRQLALALDTVQKLKDKGIPPKAVAPSLLFPILDAGSLADDPALREKWVNLLGRAASDEASRVLPGFPRVLAELTPDEVRVLDILASSGNLWSVRSIDLSELDQKLGLVPETAVLYAANFVRLGIWKVNTGGIDRNDMSNFLDDREIRQRDFKGYLSGHKSPEVALYLTESVFDFTHFGTAFVEACKPL